MKITRRAMLGAAAMGPALGAALPLGTASPAQAQLPAGWPNKPIKVIVNYAPGGSTDNATRPFMDHLTRGLGQQVVVDNRSGASGQVGVEAGVKSPPDGYNFFVTPVATLTILANARKVPFDPFKDMIPVSRYADSTLVVAVHPSVPANTLQELVALGKAQPGKLNFGSSGLGTMTQFICEGLKLYGGFDMLHVPYRGGAESLADFLAGVTQVFSEGNIMPHVKAGKAKLLAVIDSARHPDFPDVPMITEVFPEMDFINWFGMFAPIGTPEPIVARIAEELAKAAKNPELQAHMIKLALRTHGGPPAELASILRKDYDRYGKMVRDLKIRMD